MRAALSSLQPSLIRQIHALKRPSSLDLSLGEPALRTDAELWRRGLARYEREPQGYTQNLGLPALRDAIVAHHGLPKKEAIVTVGSEEALFLAFFTLLDAGDEVVIMDPAYPAYAGLATLCGAKCVRVALRAPHWSLEAQDVLAALTERTKLIVLGSPSNPFGRIDRARELERLANCGVTVLSDEIYRDLAFASLPSIATMSEDVIVVSGLSKSCAMTGHRLGYLLAPKPLVSAMWPVHQLAVTAASTLAQQLAIEAFAEPRFLTQHRPLYAERWQRAKQALQMYHIPYIEPEGGFYVMCPIVPEGEDAFAFCKRMLAEHDVVIVPGTAFGPSGAPFVRMSFAAEPEIFAEACRRLFNLRCGA